MLITIFSIAMAFLESAVVVYLRELYYPDGFMGTFNTMPQRIIIVELIRELATLLMLLSVGCIAGQTKYGRLAWFLYCFAVWDIFYYVWLKVFIDWPQTIFDWDILFLLPVTWLGPILAPVICSIAMIVFSLWILKGESNGLVTVISKSSRVLIIAGSLVIYFSFTKDYTSMIIKNGFYKDLVHIMQNPAFIDMAKTFVPESFSWLWFLIGLLLISAGFTKSLIH